MSALAEDMDLALASADLAVVRVPTQVAGDGGYTCAVCWSDGVPEGEFAALPCGHGYCLSCWKAHVKAQEAESPFQLRCMAEKCTQRVTDRVIMRVCDAPAHAAWKHRLVWHSAEEHPYVRWCKNPDCHGAILASAVPLLDVRCGRCAGGGARAIAFLGRQRSRAGVGRSSVSPAETRTRMVRVVLPCAYVDLS